MVSEEKIQLVSYSYSRYRPCYCTFNLNNEFILYCEAEDHDKKDVNVQKYKSYFNSSDKKIISIYSMQTKNGWIRKWNYKISDDFELISISKYNKLYLLINNSIYEWNMLVEKSIRLFINKENEVMYY